MNEAHRLFQTNLELHSKVSNKSFKVLEKWMALFQARTAKKQLFIYLFVY